MPATRAKTSPRKNRRKGPESATIRVAGTFAFTFGERLRLLFGRPARWEAIATVQLDTASHRIEHASCTVDPLVSARTLRLGS